MWSIIVKIGKCIGKIWSFFYRHAMAIAALALAWMSYKNHTVADNTGRILEVNKGISEEVSTLNATTLKLIAQQDSIKEMLLSQQGDIDSLKAQIDSLNICIDKHFHSVNETLNTRFSYIDGRLQDIKD